MKRTSQVLLIGLAGFAALFALGVLAINLYIQSPGVQLRLQRAASESLGVPITFFRITFAPWDGFHFQDVKVYNPASDIPTMRARDLRIDSYYLPLLRNKLIVRQIVLTGAEIRLVLGNRPPIAKQSSNSPIFNSPERAERTTSVPPKQSESTRSILPSFFVEIRKLKIRDSSLRLVDAAGSAVAEFNHLNGTVQLSSHTYSGKLQMASATLFGLINLQDLDSVVEYKDGKTSFRNMNASISGGKVNGEFTVNLTQGGDPYQIRCEISGVNVNEVTSRAGGLLDRAHGSIQGSFNLSGMLRDANAAQGSGKLELKTAYLDQLPVLQEIGRWTQIDELKRLDLDQAATDFRVAGRDIVIDNLRLLSRNCDMNLHGTIQNGQNLSMDGRLVISQFLGQKIPSELEDNFVPLENGQRSLDFQVKGTVLRPQTNLFERIVGDRTRLLRRILRGGKRHEKQEPGPSGSQGG
ncbi:MAG: AsmA family protein [Verrucomicrobia bacterium]|nr:AsmA family protein [Verrucomicrobiota bacterium]